ncbi:hypothetical protein ACFW04_014433 [Cataglyphis niger]
MNQNTFNSQKLGSFIFESSLYLVPFRSIHHLRNSSTLLDLCIIDDRDKLKEFGQRGVAFLSAHDLIFIRNLPAPWLTDWIRIEMLDRDLAKRTWRRHKNDVYYDRYKMLRNRAQNLVRSAKREYYVNTFNREGRAFEVWGRLRHLGLTKARDTGGRLSHSVEELNAFFGHNALPLELCNIAGYREISRAKSNAVGGDGISLRLLTIHCTLPILEHLFNFSLMNGVFPVKWKSALICPIPKVRNPTLVQHYRPTSILSTLSKALERLVCA